MRPPLDAMAAAQLGGEISAAYDFFARSGERAPL
jgi:hypothetical protein